MGTISEPTPKNQHFPSKERKKERINAAPALIIIARNFKLSRARIPIEGKLR